MNKLKFGPILISMLSLFVIISVAWAADLSIENKVTVPSDRSIWTIDSKENPREADVALTLTNMLVINRPPLDIILAIDGSGSLIEQGGTDPERLRVGAAQQFVNNLDPAKDRVGIVHWNDTVVGTPLVLTSDFTAAKEYLNLSDAEGYTSIWEALNASAYLLKGARPNAKKVIILFSDGLDTSNPALDFKGLAGQIKQSGVQIYTIGLGKSNIADLEAIGKYYHVAEAETISSVFDDVAADILGSLDNVQVKYIIPPDLELFNPSENLKIASISSGQIVTWDIGSMIPKKSKTLSFKVRSQNIGVYPLGMAPNSVVTYTKADGTSGTQVVPSAEINVKGDGRFFYKGDGKGGLSDGPLADPPLDLAYRLSVDKSIQPPSDGGCQDIVIDVTTPPVQGKTEVVFALDSSGSTGHNGLDGPIVKEVGAALSRSRNVEYARVDWDGDATVPSTLSERLAPPIDPPYRPFHPAGDWIRFDSDPLESRDFESTVYASGLNEAVRRIENRKYELNNSCFIEEINEWAVIFITGKSEFSVDGLDDAINKANASHVKIHTIGIGISESDPETRQEAFALEDISQRTGGQVALDVGIDELDQIIDQLLVVSGNTIAAKHVVRNVVLTESIYPYLRVVGSTPMASEYPNSDGTTTLVWKIGDMKQNQNIPIVINTALDLSKLPIDVTGKRTSVSYTPSTTTPPSAVTYTTICGAEKPPILLPEGELSIFCGEPCSSPKSSQVQVVEQVNTFNPNNTTVPVDVKKQPGFEALAAILGLMAMACTARRE